MADEVEGPVLNEVKETAVFSRDDKVVILSEDFREALVLVSASWLIGRLTEKHVETRSLEFPEDVHQTDVILLMS